MGQHGQTKVPTSSAMHMGAAIKAFVLSLTPAWAPSSESAPPEFPCAKLPMCPWTQPRPISLTNLLALKETERQNQLGQKGTSTQQHRATLNPGYQQGSSG